MKFIALKILEVLSFWLCMFMCVCVAMRFVTAQQKPNTILEVPAKVVSVYDGDTATLEFNIKANVRLLDCWAPEIRSRNAEEKKKGLASKEYLESLLKTNDEVYVRIPFDGNLSNSLSLSRILGNVYKDIDGDGVKDNISEVMVKKGYATKTKEK